LKGKTFAGRKRLLGAQAGKAGDKPPAAKVDLSDDLKAEIVALSRSGHRWLSENFNLPLAKYNYPL